MTKPDSTLSVSGYFKGLAQHVGDGWNRFWFKPSDVLDLCVLRVAVGLLVFSWFLSFSFDLVRLYGEQGVLSDPVIRGVLLTTSGYEWAYLRYVTHPAALWVVHAIGGLALLALTTGFWTRAAAVASFLVLLTYVHRGLILITPVEPILTMMVAYLCLAPIGAYVSLDARRRSSSGTPPPLSWSATLARRLIQVHLLMIHLTIGLSALGGQTWWQGDAIWWLSAQPDSWIVDLSFLRSYPILLNLWSHLIVVYFLAFPVLVWNRWIRPLALGVSVLIWISLAIATANLGLGATMILANLAFVPSEFWHGLLRRRLSTA